jgi:hypothetical protein
MCIMHSKPMEDSPVRCSRRATILFSLLRYCLIMTCVHRRSRPRGRESEQPGRHRGRQKTVQPLLLLLPWVRSIRRKGSDCAAAARPRSRLHRQHDLERQNTRRHGNATLEEHAVGRRDLAAGRVHHFAARHARTEVTPRDGAGLYLQVIPSCATVFRSHGDSNCVYKRGQRLRKRIGSHADASR